MRRKGGKEEKEEKEDWETGIYCLTRRRRRKEWRKGNEGRVW